MARGGGWKALVEEEMGQTATEPLLRDNDNTAQQAVLTDTDKFERLIAALMQQKSAGIDIDALRAVLSENSKAVAKTMRPENETHPGMSAFSHPEGDIARPRVALPFELLWNNYPVHKFPETQHWRELELMAKLKPGVFKVLMKDGTPMTVTVKADRNAKDEITRIVVEFPVSREDKFRIPPMSALLYQIVTEEGTTQTRFIAAMTEHLNIMLSAAVGA
jgi:hypothetical protein